MAATRNKRARLQAVFASHRRPSTASAGIRSCSAVGACRRTSHNVIDCRWAEAFVYTALDKIQSIAIPSQIIDSLSFKHVHLLSGPHRKAGFQEKYDQVIQTCGRRGKERSVSGRHQPCRRCRGRSSYFGNRCVSGWRDAQRIQPHFGCSRLVRSEGRLKPSA
jgi:hypothetical protein